MATFEALKKKYAGFAVPAVSVKVGGTALAQSEYTFSDVSVDNEAGEAAGAARFTLANVYDRGKRRFDAAALGKLTPGGKVSIALGYGSDTTEVFTGYIDECAMRFRGGALELTALCLDARALMRGGSAFAAAKGKTAQDAAAAVLNKYKPLISSTDVTLEGYEHAVNITQAGGDLGYVAEAARARGALFYIDCGKAYIGAAKDAVCVEFDWEQFEMDFSVRYLDEKLTAYGYDAGKMERFTVEAAAKQKAKQENLLSVPAASRVPLYIPKDSAKKRVDALAAAKADSAVFGTIYCSGLPEVKLGRKVKVNNFPMAALNAGSAWTVTRVSHRLDAESGFETEIGVGG